MARLIRQRRRIRVIPESQPLVEVSTTIIVGTAGQSIVGSGFGIPTGIVKLANIAMTVTAWTDTLITVNSADIPFRPVWAAVGLGSQPLYVANSQGGSVTTTIRVVKQTADQYVLITSVNQANSIFANDSNIVLNTDYVYWRTLTGNAGTLSGAGLFSGATNGSTGKYAIWNPTMGWSNTANVVITGA